MNLLCNACAVGAQLFNGIVRRAGVEHTNVIRLGYGVHETLDKLRLIFTDGVNADPVGNEAHLLI